MIRIKRYFSVSLAQIQAGALRAEGIECAIDGEGASSLLNVAISPGGIGLWVHADDQAQAMRILDSLKPIPAED